MIGPLGLRLSAEKSRVCHLALLTELTADFRQVVGGARWRPASVLA